jgi:hypothetical protein
VSPDRSTRWHEGALRVRAPKQPNITRNPGPSLGRSHSGGGITQVAILANHRLVLPVFGPQILVCDGSSGRGLGNIV